MTPLEARKLAIKTAAEFVRGTDFDQFWGEALAGEAWNDDALAEVLRVAQVEIARKIASLAPR